MPNLVLLNLRPVTGFPHALVALVMLLCLSGLPAVSAPDEIDAALQTDVTVRYPDIPLLKRQKNNPVACIRFFVQERNPAATLRGIEAELNSEAVTQFERLFVYANGNEPMFDTTASQTAFMPVAGKMSVPVNTGLKQGWNYLWLAAQIRDDADLDARPLVSITGLRDQGKNLLPVKTQTGTPLKRMGITIRKAWEDSVHTYRIPGVATTDRGTLIAVYDNRYKSTRDLPGHIDVGMSRSTDGGKTWEPMKVIMDMGEPHENNGIGDPAVLFDPATGTIWVAALWSKGNRSIAGSEPGLSPDESGQLMLVSSHDDGQTWSEPYNITAQVKKPAWHIYFNGPGSGMVMRDGTLVFAAQYWDETRKPGKPHSTVMYSKDHGKTWHSGTGAKPNTTESQVVETTPGQLMLNMRDQRGLYRSIATSDDLGKTWQEHPTSYSALPDPICMASIIKATVRVKGADREVLFFSNVNKVSVEHSRKDMTIKASLDLGETWLPAHQLLLDERYGYGYSSLTMVDKQTIGIVYEGERELHFMRVPVGDILEQ